MTMSSERSKEGTSRGSESIEQSDNSFDWEKPIQAIRENIVDAKSSTVYPRPVGLKEKRLNLSVNMISLAKASLKVVTEEPQIWTGQWRFMGLIDPFWRKENQFYTILYYLLQFSWQSFRFDVVPSSLVFLAVLAHSHLDKRCTSKEFLEWPVAQNSKRTWSITGVCLSLLQTFAGALQEKIIRAPFSRKLSQTTVNPRIRAPPPPLPQFCGWVLRQQWI